MRIDDEAEAREEARTIVREVARKHRKKLATARRAGDVWTVLAGPLAGARKRFNQRIHLVLRERGIFEAVVHEELVEPLDASLDRAQAEEDRDAIRDGGYREAPPRREPPAKPAKPAEPAKRVVEPEPEREEPPLDALKDQRSTGWMWIGVGIFSTVTMGALAITFHSKETLASRVQATFVSAECTLVKRTEEREEGGGRSFKIAFVRVGGDLSRPNDRYSPDVAQPSLFEHKVGDTLSCYCDPRNSTECFLDKGQETIREQIPWVYVLLFPVLFLGIGLWMRLSPTVLDSSD